MRCGRIVALLVPALVPLVSCAQTPALAPSGPSAEQIMMACMKVELPAAMQRLGVDPRMRNRDDAGALAYQICSDVVRRCAAAPTTEACQTLLSRYGLAPGDYRPSPGAALFDAAFAGNADRVRKLLAEGAEVNWRNAGGWTPLMIAAAERHLEAVVVLLEAKADPNQRNAYGRTALMFAARYGQLAIVERLLAAGADPNVVPTDATGWTALVSAAVEGQAAVLRTLLDKGADPAIRTRDGRTALDMARAGGHREAAQVLETAARPGT
jgi:ankyrin repeat protein